MKDRPLPTRGDSPEFPALFSPIPPAGIEPRC